MKSKVIYPKVVRGGTAVPLGKNFYYMSGKKHKDGGIDIGKNPKTGLEVEDEEIMHLTDKEVKVFSSVPFLNGKSPAEKVLQGDNPTKVFNAQQSYKKDNGINDDGTKKQSGGKNMNKKKYANKAKFGLDNVLSTLKGVGQKGIDKVGEYYKENPGAIGDTIGLAGNIVGGLIANRANNKMLDKLEYSKEPVAKQATKLKTNININPQLDKMRETVASYERDIDNNTASSRVSLARKQRGRVAGMLQTNELYGNKENMETELINNDKLNQQRVANSNTEDYNRWSEGKAAFKNAVLDKKSENTVGLIETLNSGVQDTLTRGEKRTANKNNMLTIAAANPNVNPQILKDMGVTYITDKMVDDWYIANGKVNPNPKKSKAKSKTD